MPIAEGGPEVEVPAMPEVARFVLPVMQGSVHQIGGLRFAAPTEEYGGTLTLIARRSAQRPGRAALAPGRRAGGAMPSRPHWSPCPRLACDTRSRGGSLCCVVSVRRWAKIAGVLIKVLDEDC